MEKKKTNRFLACLLAVVLVFSGILPTPVFALENQQMQQSTQTSQLSQTSFGDIPADKRGGTFRWGVFSSPIDLNPMLAKDSGSADINGLLTRGLVYYDANFTLKPDVLAALPSVSADGLVYDFQMLSGLQWEDGKPLTAHDVKYTIDFTKNTAVNSPRAMNVESIQQVDVISDTQFRITLKSLNVALLSDLVYIRLLPKHIWESIPIDKLRTSDYNLKKTVSCGPYSLKEYSTTGGDIVLERNPKYSQGMPYNFDSIIFKVYPNQQIALQNLEMGAIDFAIVPESEYNRLLTNGLVNVQKLDRLLFDTLIYNHNRTYFQDKRVRQAFSSLLDRETIIRTAYKGIATPAQVSWHPQLPGYNQEMQVYTYNVDKAKQLLDSAGWLVGPDGLRSRNGEVFQFKLITNKGNRMREEICKIVAAQLKAVGIVAEVEVIEWDAFLKDYVDANNFDAYVGGFSYAPTGDQTVFYHSSPNLAPMNKGKYANAQLDALLESMRTTVSAEERSNTLKAIQALVNEEQPTSTIVHRNSCIGVTKAIKNVKTSGFFSTLDIANYYWDGSQSQENPLKLSFNGGVITTARTGTPAIAGWTNAAKDSPFKVTINTPEKLELTGMVSAGGFWNVTVPQDKALVNGKYLVTVEVSDAVLGKNLKYQSLTVDNSLLYEGQVTLPSGEPALGLGYVQVFVSEGYFVKSVQLDAMGKFFIGGLQKGTYRIEAVPPSGMPYSISKSINVTTDGVTPDSNMLQLTYGAPQVIGSIQTPEGEAIGGCYINVQAVTTGSGRGIGTTPSGGFYLGNLPDGTYDLRAVPNASFTRSDLGASKPFRITITNGFSSFGNVTLKLAPVQLSGVIVNDLGQPVPNSFVTIFNASDRYVSNVEAKADGKFVVSGLEDGAYDLEARLNNSTVYTKSKRQRVQVVGGVVTPNTISLALTRPQVTGTVKNIDGTPHLGGFISYGLKNSGSRFGYGYDGQGNFAIGGLVDGVYELYANPNQNADNLTRSVTVTFEIKEGKLQNGTNPFDLTLQESLLKAVVKSPAGMPSVRSHLQIKDANGMYLVSVSTNEQGICYLPKLAPGMYQISAEPDSNSAVSVSKSNTVQITVEQGKVLTVELQLQAPQVKGIIGNPDGSAAIYSWIEVRSASGQWLNNANANSNAEFFLSGLADGQYKLIAYPWYRNTLPVSKSSETTINVLNGKLVESRVELKLTPAQVSGKVLNVNGSPASAGWIQLLQTSSGRWLNGVSVNAQGEFALSGLAPGAYTIEAVPNRQDSGAFNSQKVSFVVDPEGKATSGWILQYSAPQVNGVVKDPLGNGVSNVWLEIYNDQGAWVPGQNSNVNGEFSLGNLEVGKTYTIVANPRSGSRYSKSLRTQFTVGASPINLTLALTNATVEGEVTLPDGTAAPYTFVSVFKKQMGYNAYVQGISVGQDGKFGIGGLEPGDYEVFAGGGQYGQYRQSTGASLTIKDNLEPSSSLLKLTMRKPQVSGKTLLDDETPVSIDGYVELYNESAQRMYSVNLYGGQYAFNYLGAGKYSVKGFVKPGENVLYGDSDQVAFEIGDDGEVKSGTTTRGGIDLLLSKNFVSGMVMPKEGVALGKAWVEVGFKADPSSQDITWLKTVLVGNNGKFAISGLEDKTYFVQGFYMNGLEQLKTPLLEIVVINKTSSNPQLMNMVLMGQ